MTPRLDFTDLGATMPTSPDSSQRAGMRYTLNKLPPVSEIVHRKEDFGIEGYYIPEFNAALDKPLVYRFSPTKKRKTFIDFEVKLKDFMPSSTRYNVTRSLLDPKKGLMTSKGKRKMFSEEI